MGQRQKDHKVLNVYGSEEIRTVENAVQAAMEEGASDTSEALRQISSAYTGWDASEE